MILNFVSSVITLASVPLYGPEQPSPSSAIPHLTEIPAPTSTPSEPDASALGRRTIFKGIVVTPPASTNLNDRPLPDLSPEDARPVAEDTEDIVVSGRRPSHADPLARANIQSYKAVHAVDGAVVAPLAKGYRKAFPKPVRDGIHNFLDNVQEPIVFLNYLFQLKPGKAIETLGRFAVNTTVGVAGVIDMAKRCPINLPHRPNSLANTLGYYGVGPGPYLFLPIIGPTSVRDLFGTSVDRLALPATLGTPFNKSYYTVPANILSALDYRVAFDQTLTTLHSAPDPYPATRNAYLQRRKAEIDRLHSPSWNARHLVKPSTVPVMTKSQENCRRGVPR
ncbi:VacJ family lipoprotein [Sphingomonas sp. PB2P12]|uniref:MlaA family lipoprotein n=1 Tax=Sphingomonas sandaracina TaxID=3096157 RepID=UPI002FCB6472